MPSAAEATTIPLNVAARRVTPDRLRMAVSGEPGTLVGQAKHSEHIVDGQIETADREQRCDHQQDSPRFSRSHSNCRGEAAVEDDDETDLEDEDEDVAEVAAAAR